MQLEQGEAGGYPMPLAIERQPSLEILSIRSMARTYTATSRLERELLDSLPRSAVGETAG